MLKKIIIPALNKLLTPFELTVDKRNNKRKPGYHRLNKIPNIKTVIDIGVGDQGTPFLYKRYPKAFYISIDPIKETKKAIKKHLLTDNNIFYEMAVGSNGPSKVTINISQKPSRTSLLKRKADDYYSQVIEEREVSIDTLDNVLKGLYNDLEKLQKPCLVKIDTEGYELECLKGSKETLKYVDYIILELPLTDNFESNYSFSDVISLLKSYNFEVFQILKAGNNTTDLLFTKSDDTIREKYSYGKEK